MTIELMTETRLANNYKTKVGPITLHTPAAPSASHPYTLLNRNLNCWNVCGRTLGCGRQSCAAFCYDDCAPSEGSESVWCWCGKEEKEVGCGVVWEG